MFKIITIPLHFGKIIYDVTNAFNFNNTEKYHKNHELFLEIITLTYIIQNYLKLIFFFYEFIIRTRAMFIMKI